MNRKRTTRPQTLTRSGGSRLWRSIRAQVLDRDDHICHWCGGIASQADHLVARAEGGTDDLDNLVASCGPCNAKRGVQTRERLRVFRGDRPPTTPSRPKISPTFTEKHVGPWQPAQL